MILSDSEEMLVIIAGAAILMAIIGNVVKDYRKMTREARRKIAQQERDEAYIRALKKTIDEKNASLQKALKKKQQQ
ncbi:MAG: hypothetical protein ACPHUE_02560 [Flavobacteriaceae bacterium]